MSDGAFAFFLVKMKMETVKMMKRPMQMKIRTVDLVIVVFALVIVWLKKETVGLKRGLLEMEKQPFVMRSVKINGMTLTMQSKKHAADFSVRHVLLTYLNNEN